SLRPRRAKMSDRYACGLQPQRDCNTSSGPVAPPPLRLIATLAGIAAARSRYLQALPLRSLLARSKDISHQLSIQCDRGIEDLGDRAVLFGFAGHSAKSSLV